MSRLKLCVFPNDPIISYYDKGEIKDRYYNPCNTFDEIDIISFTDNDVEESKVQTIAGDAKLKIHSVGRINLKNRSKNVNKILQLVRGIKPDIIRTYNPLVEGWFAAKCTKELRIPLFVSLHIQYDGLRNLYKKTSFKRYLGLKYTEKFIEPFILKNADKITIVYKILESYVKRHGGKNPELLYNKIDFKRFSEATSLELPKPLVISVGRLTEQKNHQCLIESMRQVNANLLIIGNGELHDKLSQQIRDLNLQNKITIKKSVPNNEIQRYYKSADVFALAYDTELEGLPIPVMEAMASGLPVIVPYPKNEYSDGLEQVVVFSNRDSNSFAQELKKVLLDSKLRQELSAKSLRKAKEFDIDIMEKREADIYLELLRK
ncbi:MAG: hypothetical protein AUI92_04495 [Thaumarchaeota archaeon 13_1_40CM_3_38_6]|nr:MAG: hypothetical protein AUI92_04495 [Thaumarchaeota archaeon 13_1_40CM_3_38_6]